MARPSSKIDLLLQQALSDKSAEPAFWKALLDVPVYAHVPKHDDTGRLRFIQFVTPEGVTVLPFFTDEAQALQASSDTVKTVMLSGRQLMEATRGATLMLNPNQTPSTLYPEEIVALLDHGEVAVMESEVLPERQMLVAIPEPKPDWLIKPLVSLYQTLDYVDAAYVAEIRLPEAPDQRILLVVLAVAKPNSERAARASVMTMQPICAGREIAVDLTTFEPGSPPAWIVDSKIKEFYSKVTSGNIVH
jgi:hypothetical protein